MGLLPDTLVQRCRESQVTPNRSPACTESKKTDPETEGVLPYPSSG